jgi:hypothetical protein
MASSGCLSISSRIWSNTWPCTLLEFFRHFLHCLTTVTLNMEFLFVFDDFIFEGLTTVVTYD